jgi:hypothetical protein
MPEAFSGLPFHPDDFRIAQARIIALEAALIAANDALTAAVAALQGDLTVEKLTVTTEGVLISAGGLVVSEGPVTLPAGIYAVRRWVSDSVTQADIVGGAASEAINLADFPTEVVTVGAYLKINTPSVTSDPVASATLQVALSIATVVGGFLSNGANLMGAAAGRVRNYTGALMGGYSAADTPQMVLTVGGAGPDTAHLTTFDMQAVILYLETAAE